MGLKPGYRHTVAAEGTLGCIHVFHCPLEEQGGCDNPGVDPVYPRGPDPLAGHLGILSSSLSPTAHFVKMSAIQGQRYQWWGQPHQQRW